MPNARTLSLTLLLGLLAPVALNAEGAVTLMHWEKQPRDLRIISQDKGIIAAWINPDESGSSVGIQNLDLDGKPRWGGTGLSLGSHTTKARGLRVAADHRGGAVVVWQDTSGTGDIRQWVQAVSDSGKVRWPSPGLQVGSSPNTMSAVAVDTDDAGRIYLAWSEKRDGKNVIVGQVIGPDGALKWGEEARTLVTMGHTLTAPFLAGDRQGGFFIAWNGLAANQPALFVQSVSSLGGNLWGASGKTISAQPKELIKSLTWTTGKDLYVTWKRNTPSGDLWMAQAVDATGKKKWAEDGITLNMREGQDKIQVSVDPAGKIVMVWEDATRAPRKVFIQQWDKRGVPIWDFGNGAPVAFESKGEQQSPWGVVDEQYAYAIWLGNADRPWEIFAQRLTDAGKPDWGNTGKLASPPGSFPKWPMAVADHSGGLVVFWVQSNAADQWELQGRRLNRSGSPVW